MKKMKKLDHISFRHEGEDFRVIIWDCAYCDNRVLKLGHADTSEIGSPYGRVNYSHQGYLAGGRKQGLLLCDACLGMSKKIKEIKNLEAKEKKLLETITFIKETAQQIIDDTNCQEGKQ